ncbi:MAG: beta-galactosidase, partial [Demequinaceae bacterium]|nr:beta-galactosidase [Demequinaceae bacterium]
MTIQARWPEVAGLAYGGDYNPEQWPRATWDDDVRLMREAGVNLVSVGIFSWAMLEPKEGGYTFGWLDELLNLLHAHGIAVDLGTPTASPPAWFFVKHPEARVVARDGRIMGFGSRGMASHSSAAYREASATIATMLAERYGKHPAVVMWHVHNEYGVPVGEDYSADSVAAFREWLGERYGSLDALNGAWGTAFWGQRYGEWSHVGPPADAPSVVNPAQRLDFARFTDHQILRCFIAER